MTTILLFVSFSITFGSASETMTQRQWYRSIYLIIPKIMAGTVLLIIADLSWFFVVGDIWKTDVEDSKFWASMQTSYTLIMFVSVLSLIAKLGIVGLIHMFRLNPGETAHLIGNNPQEIN